MLCNSIVSSRTTSIIARAPIHGVFSFVSKNSCTKYHSVRSYSAHTMAEAQATSSPSYKDVLRLLSPPNTPTPLLAAQSPKPHNPKLATKIAALEVHPTLEALLHLLNSDLSSAHFLVRHMEVSARTKSFTRLSIPKHQTYPQHQARHRIRRLQI